MQKLTEHTYGVLTNNNFLNAYVIDNGGALTIVDVGQNAEFAGKVLGGIRSIGKSTEDVAQIVITHAHADHYGGLKALQDQCNAPTYAHRIDALIIQGEQTIQYADPSTLGFVDQLITSLMLNNLAPPPPARVDRVVDDGDVLDTILPGTQVVHLPGHSYGQIGLWLPDEKTLIGGDVMMVTPLRPTMPIRAASPDWEQAKASVRKALDLQPENLMLGHGKPIIGNATQIIEKLAKRLKI